MAEADPRASFAPAAIDPEAIGIARLFPTPVASIRHPDHVRLDAELARVILARARDDIGVARSNDGGWQSDGDFDSWCGPAGIELLRFAAALASEMSAIRTPSGDLRAAEIDWMFNAWANINHAGHANDPHIHSASYWSGVYWVDDGREGDAAPAGGTLQFHDPHGPVATFLAPSLRMRIEGCLEAGLTHDITPESGTLLLFPSWLLHAVTRYAGTRPRISIAFNFAPRM